MDYNKRYDLEKGMKWLIHRLKQERFCLKSRKQAKSSKMFSQIRIELYEDLIKKFMREENG